MTDQRLIEDYIPIEAISAESRREKSVRKGHISTLHLWWARRPLVSARAAVYGALVSAPADKKAARQAEDFVTALCKYPGASDVIAQAQRHILEAHAARLSEETGHLVTAADIEAGRAPRPRVLDMFAGGGAIPLEALRLGCESYALDLNPVAHLIQLCTLVYPQKYGAADPAAKGSAKDGSWAGLAKEVEHWGKWVLKQAQAEIGDLYPPIPDPEYRAPEEGQLHMGFALPPDKKTAKGMLTPIAYLWTRTVRCKNPACGGTVPLARQTWLAKKRGRYIALRPDTEANRHRQWPHKTVRYRVMEATTESGLGFNPSLGSRGGNVPCPFCGTVVDSAYVKDEGNAGHMGMQPMAVIGIRKKPTDKAYLSADEVPAAFWGNTVAIQERIQSFVETTAKSPSVPITLPNEPIEGKLSDQIPSYGMTEFKDIFSPRQLLLMLTLVKCAHIAHSKMRDEGLDESRANAVSVYLAIAINKQALRSNTLCTWATTSAGGRLTQAFGRQALEMVWDFAESNPFSSSSGSFGLALKDTAIHADILSALPDLGSVSRGTATSLPFESVSFDAVVTDPPYYDNIFYADLSDFFFVWFKRTIGHLFPAHFSSNLSPKRREIVASPWRHETKSEAKNFYETLLTEAMTEACRVLKPNAPLVVVYAHKTTAGWATLIDALRVAGFVVTEAWPIDTELTGHRKAEMAALASSIFLVARRRENQASGSYEQEVQPELSQIVRERVETLWGKGVTGADLVIACVGAGLRAFTRFARVEYANGEDVPANSFLSEVEGAVLEALLEKLFGVAQAGVGAVDGATRFYVLWRYAYRYAAVDAGEAILFAYPQHVELDGPGSLSYGVNPLVSKERSKYRLRDFMERGGDSELGQPQASGPASFIDVLHRLLWLMEYRPNELPDFLDQAQPDLERLKIVAQTLAGPALSGGAVKVSATGEAAALRKLTANWRSVIEENLYRKRM